MVRQVPNRSLKRRRRLVVITLALLAALVGAVLGSGHDRAPQAHLNPASSAALDPRPPGPQAQARRVARGLRLGQLAGQRLIAGVPGTTIPPALRQMITRGEIAGVILFADNFPSRAAGRRLIRRLQAIPRPKGLRSPLLITIDQEGGLVKRIDGAPAVSAAEMGRRGPTYSRRQGRLTGRNLRNVGVNVNLAPVLDVGRAGGDIAKTDRAFGTTAVAVARTALPFAQGLRSSGVAATAKHFPGLGAVSHNTDFAAQTIDLPKRTLRRVDQAPYRDFIAAGGELVMLSTAIYPAYSRRPAAFSPEIVTRELRRRLGFRGVTITDAMGTVAVNEFSGPAQATVLAARAGVDLLLYTDYRSAQRARKTLVAKLAEGKLKRAQSIQAVTRVLTLRQRLSSPSSLPTQKP